MKIIVKNSPIGKAKTKNNKYICFEKKYLNAKIQE